MKTRKLFFILAAILLFACKKGIDSSGTSSEVDTVKDYPALGDAVIEVFKGAPVTFSGAVKNFQENADGTIQLIQGRVILKKVELPKYTRDVKLRVDIRLVSAGDDFDRSGSCFIIPSDAVISMLDIAKGEKQYPKQEGKLEGYPGIIAGKDYKPAVEALRFMTPFGVGHFNYIPKPPHVDKWADYVEWNADISHLMPLLKNGAYMGIWIDTWKHPGFKVDLKLTATESKENKPAPKRHVESLLNTVCYAGQHYPDVFNKVKKEGIDTITVIPENAKNIRLFYTTTGHGGHNGGDEFVKRENIIKLDGQAVDAFKPWIDSCKAFRKFNPSSAVWGNVASSDLARSNWCPGSDVKPKIYNIDEKTKGEHTFNFAIPKAQVAINDYNNFWLVSAYLAWEE